MKTELPGEPLPAELILNRFADAWVRQFREILDETRPQALLGTFHCPWSETDFDGALRRKLAVDLKAESR